MKSYDPLYVTTAVTLFANVLSEYFTSDELAVLAAVFAQLGDTLATISAVNITAADAEKANDDKSQD